MTNTELEAIVDESAAISGLAAPKTRLKPGKTRNAMKVVAKKAYSKGMLKSTLTREQRFLEAKIGVFAEQTQKDIKAGKVDLRDGDYYVRRKLDPIGGGSVVKLLEPSSVKVVGITNFDKNQLNERENLILSKVRIAYAAFYYDPANPPVSLPNPADVMYHNQTSILNLSTAQFNPNPDNFWVNIVPPQLVGGEFRVIQDDKPIVALPMARFFTSGWQSSNQSQARTDAVELNTLKLVRENTDVGIEIRVPETTAGASLPSTVVVGATTYNVIHFVEVRLIGQLTVRK